MLFEKASAEGRATNTISQRFLLTSFPIGIIRTVCRLKIQRSLYKKGQPQDQETISWRQFVYHRTEHCGNIPQFSQLAEIFSSLMTS